MLRAAYLGPQGTFSEEAATVFGHYCGVSVLQPCSTISRCARAVEEGEAEYAVVPLENSLEGSVHETLDLLTASAELKIQAELDVPIELCLLSSGTEKEAIRVICSHPHALGQCRNYLQQFFPGTKTIPVLSTAEAAAVAAAEGPGTAAIAGRQAAKKYGLAVVAAGIADSASVTRFIALGLENSGLSRPEKTSLVFAVKNAAGSLYAVLRAFAEYKVNLTKIESRPAKSRLGEYIFFVDLDGTPQDAAVKAAVSAAAGEAVMLKLLGSYPVLRYAQV
ncbi:MAG TPA: prephenate dehydratase [Firmicutes bacterium]|nr:prephenate dehydratase [Bacillota bacterium]